MGYDEAGRLLSIINELTGTPFSSYVYTHDGVGNRETMTDLDGLHDYTYDDLYRLSNADHPQPQYPDNDESFTYDAIGNRLTSAGYPTWSYDDNNRLTSYNGTSYTYDNNGNIITKTVGTEVTTYEYDIENRLVRINYPDATYSEYKYDPFGRRIEKDVDGVVTKYLYDGEDILYELDNSNQIISRFTHGPGIDEPIILERDTDVYYYHTDGLGSITKLTDINGTVVQSYTYDSFGNIVEQSGSVTQPYTYTGREYDSESGLYYYRFRYYDPSIGRFLSEDPIGFLGGDINLYVYVWNNPANLIDPLGLFPNWLIPPYGRYGGPGRTGPGKPIDSMDACFLAHDECYKEHKIKDWDNVDSCNEQDKNECDLDLFNCLAGLSPSPYAWDNPPPWWLPESYTTPYRVGHKSISGSQVGRKQNDKKIERT